MRNRAWAIPQANKAPYNISLQYNVSDKPSNCSSPAVKWSHRQCEPIGQNLKSAQAAAAEVLSATIKYY